MRSTDRAHGCSSASARLDRQPDRTDDRRIQFRPVAELARKAEDWEFPGLLLADSQDLNADIWSNSAWPARRPRGCSSARTCPCRRRRGGRRLALTAGLPRDGAGNRRSAAAANAVTKNGDGTVSVEINALHDAEGLERNLHQGDIPAVVRYLPPDQGRRSDTFTVIIPARATRSREAGRSRCAGRGYALRDRQSALQRIAARIVSVERHEWQSTRERLAARIGIPHALGPVAAAHLSHDCLVPPANVGLGL